ncbi:MAG: N-acetylglucosaminyl-diphospho-decaprenol L-rhamnosyltransferase [Cognaticolwellia sp.]
MSKFIIAIISHGHLDYISGNVELQKISNRDDVTVIIKDNLKEKLLEALCKHTGYTYITSPEVLGFGENNNYCFDYAQKNIPTSSADWFLVVNPDVIIECKEFDKLVFELNNNDGDFFTPNLFKNNGYTTPENSIRRFASFINLLNPFLLKPINTPYNKVYLKDKSCIEWASGAFLCIKVDLFTAVNGFNGAYFMYYEDVDLCFRLMQKGVPLRFLKNIKAVHKGEYKNRSIFSKHFRWYLTSLFRFLIFQSRYKVKG